MNNPNRRKQVIATTILMTACVSATAGGCQTSQTSSDSRSVESVVDDMGKFIDKSGDGLVWSVDLYAADDLIDLREGAEPKSGSGITLSNNNGKTLDDYQDLTNEALNGENAVYVDVNWWSDASDNRYKLIDSDADGTWDEARVMNLKDYTDETSDVGDASLTTMTEAEKWIDGQME